jgi:hypothetical protein
MDAGIILDAGTDISDAGTALLVTIPEAAHHGLGPGFFNLENMLSYQNGILIMAAWAITEMVSRATRKMSNADLRTSVLMIMPLLLCIAFVLGTSNWQPEATVGERLLLGSLLGSVTVWGHKIAKATGMHDKIPLLNLIMAEKDDEEPDEPNRG